MISAVILTKNEEQNIVDCLERLRFCNEILVIDDDSYDRTVELAKKLGAIVFVHSLNNNFSKQRNFGLEKAKNNWVLFMDADERIGELLAKEIISATTNNDREGFYVKREDIVWGKKISYGELGSVWKLRLGKKNSGRWVGAVHESWFVKGRIGSLKNALEHYPHQNIAEFLKEINFYTDIRAKELYNLKIKIKWHSFLFKPVGKFMLNYFFKFGFLDGIQGFLIATTMSFHSFLVRGKLWTLNQKN